MLLKRYNVGLFQDSTANALAVGSSFMDGSGKMANIKFTHFMTSGTTSSTTFKVRAGTTIGADFVFNGEADVRKFGGVLASSITITEVN